MFIQQTFMLNSIHAIYCLKPYIFISSIDLSLLEFLESTLNAEFYIVFLFNSINCFLSNFCILKLNFFQILEFTSSPSQCFQSFIRDLVFGKVNVPKCRKFFFKLRNAGECLQGFVSYRTTLKVNLCELGKVDILEEQVNELFFSRIF